MLTTLIQPLEPWEEFELTISEIFGNSDFDFCYQFEMPLSKPDLNGKTKRILDYVAVFKDLFLVIDSKAWREMVTPPALQFASGKVEYTIEAVNKLFWDSCIFETGLLDVWRPKCPRCGGRRMRGNVVYVKPPDEITGEDFYVFIDERGDPMVYTHFSCKNCQKSQK
jgi:hypothetical protein